MKLSWILIILFSLFPQAHAITGNGVGVETILNAQSISADGEDTSWSINSIIGGGMNFAGNYSGGQYQGYFGQEQTTQESQSNETQTVTILSPNENYVSSNRIVNFTTNITITQAVNCSLIIDNSIVQTQNYPIIGAVIFQYNMSIGSHTWTAQCINNSGYQFNAAEERNIAIFQASNFDGETTDLSSVNLENITNLTLAKNGIGKIKFNEQVNTSGGADLDSYVQIGNRTITINTAMLPQLNKSATLTMYNSGLTHPVILRDGIECQECSIINTNPDLIFNVSHFTTYSATDNSQLTIWDDTDSAAKYLGNQIYFYANYSQVPSGTSISGPGISCEITFPDTGSAQMIYNGTNSIYIYNRSFNTTGSKTYLVNCTDVSDTYKSIELSENTVVSVSTGPTGVTNISIRKTERANISTTPAYINNVDGGNVTDITLTAKVITPSWEGIYGNISASINLEDANGNTFYNWSGATQSGEVYATRTASPDFQNIHCSNNSDITLEETALGQNPLYRDTVTNTFNKTTHPGFSVGSIWINESSCKSTNTYINNQVQETSFSEVILSDSTGNMIYTSMINSTTTGFNNKNSDFQMLIGANGHDTGPAVAPYYFFIELS